MLAILREDHQNHVEMRIVLSGIESNNKGAELMLYAILQEIERQYPGAEVYVPLYAIKQGLDYIHTKVHLKDKPYAWWKRKVVPKLHLTGIMRRMGLPYLMLTDSAAVRHADYFIDASGFSFSDQWHPDEYRVKALKYMLSSYKRQGTKVIYLPQAFGPVKEENTQKLVSVLNSYADVIMPRESVSYDYLLNAHVYKTRMKLFTDFTSLVEGKCPEKYSHLAGCVCVIPNARMIDKGVLTYEQYVQALTQIIREVKEEGKSVYILSHEIASDDPLCEKLGESLKGEIEVITGLNAIEVKGLISTSYLCITSRFHGAASALNSCVPCLASSWSHKYALLFADYDQTDCILDLKDMDTTLSKIEEYISPAQNQQIRQQLSRKVPLIKQKNREMWDLVWST